jgi:hypothetical protein
MKATNGTRARVRKVMHENARFPVTNPNDYVDFEVSVDSGRLGGGQGR